MHVRDLFDLTGKVALVTGGSRGLGKEMAIGLGEAGASVVITARRESWLTPAGQELRGMGIDCMDLVCDVANPDDVQRVIDRTLERYGKVDILVNNAGISWGASPEDMPLEKWKMVLEVNVTGTFICSQLVGREMIKRRQGKIINIASVAGLLGVHPEVMDAIGYHASKGAVVAFTRDLAVKWAKYNIYVNAIAPGFFPTRMTEPILKRSEEEINKSVPLGRVGREGELKGVAVFLASDASNYITGQVISVDGGASAW